MEMLWIPMSVDIGWNSFGLGEQFWTVAVLAAAIVIALLMLFIRHEIPYSLVVIWAFSGILVKRLAYDIPADSAVEIAAISGIVILGLGLVYTAIRTILKDKKPDT
jgi:hypothetical protein